MNAIDENTQLIAQFINELNTIDYDGTNINVDTNLEKDLGLNSLSVLLLIIWLKDNVKHDIFDYVEDVNSLIKVGDVLALLERKS